MPRMYVSMYLYMACKSPLATYYTPLYRRIKTTEHLSGTCCCVGARRRFANLHKRLGNKLCDLQRKSVFRISLKKYCEQTTILSLFRDMFLPFLRPSNFLPLRPVPGTNEEILSEKIICKYNPRAELKSKYMPLVKFQKLALKIPIPPFSFFKKQILDH